MTSTVTTSSLLTHDEHKAAEAAFRGLPLNPQWSARAQAIFLGITAVTNGQDVATETDRSCGCPDTSLIAK